MASVTPMGQNPDPTYRIAKHHVGTRLISARCLPLLNTAPSWYTTVEIFLCVAGAHSTAGPPRVLYLAKRVVLSELQKSSPRPGGLTYFFKIPNSPSFLLSTMVGSPSAPVRYPPHRGKRKYLSWLVLCTRLFFSMEPYFPCSTNCFGAQR